MSTSNRGLRWLALAALISTLGCLAGEWFGAGKEESSTFVQVDGPADEPTAEVEVEEPSPTPPPTPNPAPTKPSRPIVAAPEGFTSTHVWPLSRKRLAGANRSKNAAAGTS